MIINKSGIVIRIAVEGLRVMGRATQGVRLINLKDNDEIASITKVDREEESEEESEETENSTEGDNEGLTSEENIDSNEE
ncbi:DNA gyrase subunit A [compost metagenome]